jgi:lipopolysaccharide biosynthesis protein
MALQKVKSKVFAAAQKNVLGRKLVDRGVITKRQIRQGVRRFKHLSKDLKAESEFKGLKQSVFERSSGVNTVVVLHLFYLEAWESLLPRLKRLSSFDLVVTMPKQNLHFETDIKTEFPNARVVLVPNRGRDVLGFVGLLPLLAAAGYKSVLKVHSKKSTHRTDGGLWLNDMLDKLMPADVKLQNTLFETLALPDTAVVGPDGHYVSLRVNFDPNKHYLLKSLSAYYGKRQAQKILTLRSNYGFFAGTMFWARIDAFKAFSRQKYGPRHFDFETGQIDSTLAHALERLFCLVPAIEKKNIYKISEKDVKKIPYKTTNIPDWSDVYIEPTKKN